MKRFSKRMLPAVLLAVVCCLMMMPSAFAFATDGADGANLTAQAIDLNALQAQPSDEGTLELQEPADEGSLQTQATSTVAITIPGTANQTEARKLLGMVNDARSKKGASQLKWDPALEQAALKRAAEISLQFSHTRTDGSSWMTSCSSPAVSAENIAEYYSSADTVNTGWTNSSGHYANMVNSGFRSMGAACFVADGKKYWVELFSTGNGGGMSGAANDSAVSIDTRATATLANSVGSIYEVTTTVSHTVGAKVQLGVKYFKMSDFNWKSSNTSVASVDSDGCVTCNKVGTVTITATHKQDSSVRFTYEFTVSVPSVSYRTHVQNVGWQDFVRDGAMAGTQGRSLRLEGINVKLEGVDGGIQYRTHIQNIGWESGWKRNGAMSGTSGRALRLEAIQIQLTGNAAAQYDVYYRVHCQNFGWMGWAKNGASAGSQGFSYRLEAIEIKLVPKGGAAPGVTSAAFRVKSGSQSGVPDAESRVLYRTHVQNDGWQPFMRDGEMAGTQGRSLRLEGINIKLGGLVNGGIEYRTHIQNLGWEKNFKSNGAMSGTSGRALRLEAIEIRLTGDAAAKYDVYYRVHAQNIGWMGWAKNGERAGTAGYAYRLEGINIQLVEKGGSAPGSTTNAFRQK